MFTQIILIAVIACMFYIVDLLTKIYNILRETPQEKEIRIRRREVKMWGKKL